MKMIMNGGTLNCGCSKKVGVLGTKELLYMYKELSGIDTPHRL